MTRSSRRAAGQVLVTACLGSAIAAGGVSVASSSDTVKAPRFSNPTRIDNPYLPLSEITRSVLRGTKDGKQVRSVITPLKRTKLFRVHGSVCGRWS